VDLSLRHPKRSERHLWVYIPGLPAETTRPLARNLRRLAHITSATPWQPGTTTNWLNALFYDPCATGAGNCVTVGGVQ
jgi:hypothetical protein